jgi:hypothetical protein
MGDAKEMKTLLHDITVTARLELTARDVELLENLTSYDNKAWIESICPATDGNSYNGGVKPAELLNFVECLRVAAKHMKNEINVAARQGLVR